VLGKHSGQHALRERVRELGFELDEPQFGRVFEEFKALADRKKELFDGDIEALVLRAEGSASGPWSLSSLETVTRSGSDATASVSLGHVDGRNVTQAGKGDGPVDAAFKAVEIATGVTLRVRKFEVRSVSEGEDAQGETVVYVEQDGRSYRGASVSTNIVEGSVNALLEVINRIELSQRSATRVPATVAQTAV
jgi:2-isopropylmalate synthase